MVGAAHAVVAVAAGDDVALQLAPAALVREADAGPLGLEIVDGDVGHLEEQRQARVEAEADQVLHDLGLAVDHDRAPAGQLAQRDPMPLAVELELDAVVDDALALQALARARLDEEIDRALLEHAGPDSLLDVVAAAGLEHDRLDALALEQLRERQPGRPGADDADLRPHQPVGLPPRRARAARPRTRRSPPARRSRSRCAAAPP